jgi:type IV secretion system protein VirB4
MSDRPADEWLPYQGHIRDDIVILEDGTHVGILRLEGRALSLFGTVSRYAQRRRRHATMRSLADDNIEIFEHHVCHDRVRPFQLGEFRSAFSRELAEHYISGIESRMKAREWFISVVVRPRLTEKLGQRMLGRKAESDDQLVRQTDEALRRLRLMLREYHPRRLGIRIENGIVYSEIGEAISLVLYGRWKPVPMPVGSLSGSIYTDRVICGMRGFEVVRPGRRSCWGVMLGFREYPEFVPPNILDSILDANHRIVMTNSFRYRAAGAAATSMARRRNQLFNSSEGTSSLAEGLDDAIDEVRSGREIMGGHQWSLAVHADSLEELGVAADEIRTLVSGHMSLAPEEIGCFASYWSQVPGRSDVTEARYGDVKLMNFCSFSALVGFPCGDDRPHWDAPAIRLVSAGNTAVDLSAHVRRVGSAILMGGTGYGKTTFVGLYDVMLEQNLVPRNGFSVILDKDNSHELSVLARGGYYVKIVIGEDSGMVPHKAIPNTPAARTWFAQFVAGLIMDDGKGPLPADQQDRLKEGIRFILRLPVELRSLLALRQFLDHGDHSTGIRLDRWCKGGDLGWVFDGEEDRIRMDRSVVGIDNTAILRSDMATVLQPAASYQLFRIRDKVSTGVRSAIYVDEGASYLPDHRFSQGFEEFSRELRKANGMLWFVVHHPADLYKHPAGKTILALAPRKFLFSNPEANEDDYRDIVKCSRAEIDAVMKDMETMGEGTFLVKEATGSFIARAPILPDPKKPDLGAEFIAVLSSHPLRAALWHSIGEELGTTDPDRIWSVYRTRHKEAKQ